MKLISRIVALFRRKPSGIPVMITSDMRRGLLEMGVLPSEIREMTPQQAWDRLKQRRSWSGNFPATIWPW